MHGCSSGAGSGLYGRVEDRVAVIVLAGHGRNSESSGQVVAATIIIAAGRFERQGSRREDESRGRASWKDAIAAMIVIEVHGRKSESSWRVVVVMCVYVCTDYLRRGIVE